METNNYLETAINLAERNRAIARNHGIRQLSDILKDVDEAQTALQISTLINELVRTKYKRPLIYLWYAMEHCGERLDSLIDKTNKILEKNEEV